MSAHANSPYHASAPERQECENPNGAYGESHKHSGLLLAATDMFRLFTAHAACMHVNILTASMFDESSAWLYSTHHFQQKHTIG